MRLVTPRLCILFTLLLTLCGANSVAAKSRCVAEPGVAYEQVFCELKRLKSGASLPSLAEFRRNPATMQYLLLKRRAAQQGLKLERPAARTEVQVSKSAASGVSDELGKQVLTSPQQAEIRKFRRTTGNKQPAACRYTRDRIVCATDAYVRQSNKANSQLAKGALSAGNTLQLEPVLAGNEQDWLASAYEQYLRAMLSIGLAGSSFTYSAFAHTYYEHQTQGTDSVSRFATMFEYLKRDKKTLGVSRRKPQRAPTEDECEWLNSDLLACNSQSMNLVYTLAN